MDRLEELERAAFDAAIVACGWSDPRMITGAHELVDEEWTQENFLTANQATAFYRCLGGARAALRARLPVGEGE